MSGITPMPGIVTAAGGGGASAFTFSQSTSGTSAGALANFSFGSAIPAGCLIFFYMKWEGTGNPTGVTENGGGAFTMGTEPTPQEGGDLSCISAWLLSATGGGTQINIAYTGTCTFTRAIAMRFTYGGTATHVAAGQNSGVGTAVASTAMTNSGSFRLNCAGVGNYTGNAFDTLTIGGVAGDAEPDAQVSDTWAFYNTENLAAETANANYATNAAWVMSANCFAAN